MAFVSSMPKVELHAHLNGSVSEETLRSLVKNKPVEQQKTLQGLQTCIRDGHNRTLKECFEMFKLVHSIVNDHESLYQATCSVIDEFAADGVVYLELRSTPRAIPEAGVSQASYVETVLRAIREKTSSLDSIRYYDPSKKPIVVRYLAAIDRRNSVEHAMETVDIAIKQRLTTGLVVGVDLSGDGNMNDARDFIPVLKKAADHGLKLALHLAEVDGLAEETRTMLDIPPQRVGHGTFIHPDYGGNQTLLHQTRQLNIPLELCLTSNVKGQVTPSYDAHHFQTWYSLGHPLIVCTDDKGVFATNLSDEYRYLLDVFNLSPASVMELALRSIDHLFETDEWKHILRQYFHQWKSLQESQAE